MNQKKISRKTIKTMKTISINFLLIVAFGCAQAATSNDDKYFETMANNIEAVYSARSISELRSAVNVFERVALSEKNKWEPYYYAAFGYILIAQKEQNMSSKDAYLDQAEKLIAKAAALKPNDSEIISLEGFVHMMRISVDPASRGQQYSASGMQRFGKALSLDPNNPRALALMAQMQFGTSQFLNSPTTEACATNETALQKFSSFKSDNPLAPKWGRGMAEELISKCR
jgi:tetratricopeptide (TPR) repeat protein